MRCECSTRIKREANALSISLLVAVVLIVLVGFAHSYLGERYILQRLFRRGELPRLFGGTEFTQNTLRFAWHLTTVAWLGLGGVLLLMAMGRATTQSLGLVIGGTFLIHGVAALVGSRGKHLSWPLFLTVGLLALLSTRGWPPT